MRLITSILLLGFILLGCNKEEITPNEQTEQLLLAQVWELTETKVDGVVSNQYDGLTLSFGSGVYSTTNGGSLWPPSGIWIFADDKGTKIIRDDGLEIDIVSASAANIVLSFFWDTTVYDGGRIRSVTGNHQMTFRSKP